MFRAAGIQCADSGRHSWYNRCEPGRGAEAAARHGHRAGGEPRGEGLHMRLALISDIHGNADALRAVLADARSQGADGCVFLGDYIFDMPFSGEVVALLRALTDAVFVRGNKEHYLDDLIGQDQSLWTDEQLGVIYQTYRELSGDDVAWLRALPDERTLELPSGRRLYCTHALSRLAQEGRTRFDSSNVFGAEYARRRFSHAEYLRGLQEFYASELGEVCAAVDADVLAYGHNHMQGYGRCAGHLVVDAGSAGMPLDCDNRAAYTLLDDGDELRVTERRVAYDVEAAIARARDTSICRAGQVWSELSFRHLRTGRDHVGRMFEIKRNLERTAPEGADRNALLHAAYEQLVSEIERGSWM